MVISTLSCHFLLPGCQSLKEKRSQLKPLITRLHREFNISVSEVDKQDIKDEAVICCALVCNDHRFAEANLSKVFKFIEGYWKNLQMIQHRIEIY